METVAMYTAQWRMGTMIGYDSTSDVLVALTVATIVAMQVMDSREPMWLRCALNAQE